MLICESGCGISEIEGKAAKGSGERGGYQASFKSVDNIIRRRRSPTHDFGVFATIATIGTQTLHW